MRAKLGCAWRIQGLPFLFVLKRRQERVARVPGGAQPGDHSNKIAFGHGCATGRWAAYPAPNMKKDGAALPRNRWVGIVPNFNQPAISEVVMPHFLLLEPWRRVLGIFDRDEAIVIGALHIIDPRVRARDLMKGVIRTRRELRIVGIDFSNSKNSSRGAAI